MNSPGFKTLQNSGVVDGPTPQTNNTLARGHERPLGYLEVNQSKPPQVEQPRVEPLRVKPPRINGVTLNCNS